MSVIIQSIKRRFLEYLLPVVLGLAILLLLLYYTFKYGFPDFFTQHAWGFKELFGISLAILSSGIFLAVLKWFQFMGFFREELHKIVESSQFNTQLQNTFHDVLYSDEFLQKRNDIEQIWKKVTRCYFKSEFPDEVSDKINAKLSNVFFHNNKLSHFIRTCIITMNISIDEEGFLLIEETTESRLIRNSTDPFTYDFCYYIDKTEPDEDKSFIDIHYFAVDGEVKDAAIITSESNGDRALQKLTIELEGKKEYNIVIKSRLSYNIQRDNIYTFFNERAVEYIRVEINHSPNLNIHFIPIGNETFTDGDQKPQKFVKIYNDLLLPEKGFRLIFVKNN